MTLQTTATMKQRVEAEFMFLDGPKTADSAAAYLTAHGYEIAEMDCCDGDEDGKPVTTVWLAVGCEREFDDDTFDDDTDKFLHEMASLAAGLGGECIQAWTNPDAIDINP